MTDKLIRATEEQVRWIEAILANDEASSDQELLDHLLANEIDPDEAQVWISNKYSYFSQSLIENSRNVLQIPA